MSSYSSYKHLQSQRTPETSEIPSVQMNIRSSHEFRWVPVDYTSSYEQHQIVCKLLEFYWTPRVPPELPKLFWTSIVGVSAESSY